MSSFRGNDRSGRQLPASQNDQPDPSAHIGTGDSGCEAEYLRYLVDSRKRVAVVLTTGETLRGRVRYYDHSCFSLGPEKGRPKVFLRKDAVRYLYEEQEQSKTLEPLPTVTGSACSG